MVSEPPHPSIVPMEDEVQQYWGKRWGVSSDIGRLRTVLVHRPGDELKAIVDSTKWLWIGKPDIAKAQQEHDAMVRVLKGEGIEVLSLERNVGDRGKMYFMRDQASVTRGGVILSRMALDIRRGEERFVASRLGELNVPILRTVHGLGTLEGGNFMFLDPDTVLIGVGVRTNHEGFRQASEVLTTQGVKSIISVPQSAYLHTFPSGFVHLDVAFNVIDTDLAIMYPEGVPYDLVELVRERKMRIIEVPREEALRMSTNFLVVEPSKVITASGNEKTKKALEKEKVEVIEVGVDELMKGGGSVRCMTMPLMRDEIRG
jgi:N-dimethylarginine dimethylaminohydrolase